MDSSDSLCASATTTLPPVETISVLLMRFTETADGDLVSMVEQRLAEEGLRIVVSTESGETGRITVGITAPQERLAREAQSIRLMMKRNDNQITEAFDVENMEKYYDTTAPYRDPEGLFSSKDRSLLTFRILSDITVLPEGDVVSNLSRMLDHRKIPYRRKLSKKISLHTVAEDISLDQHPTRCLYQVLQDAGLCDAVTPVHRQSIKEMIWRKTRGFHLAPPVQEIRDYYGEEIGFYFGWMGFLTRWLIFPGILGLGAYIHRWYREDSIMSDEFTPIYGLITFVWAVLFMQFWERQECRLSYQWGVLVGEYEKSKYFAVRPEFYGRLRRSPITGRLETYYPASRRRLKYAVSSLVTALMLTVAFATMILSLNLQGYINPKHDEERWHEGNPHPFHVPFLSRLAQPGKIFDMTSSWRSLIPVLIHVATIFTLNNTYRVVATHLTEWENHETQLAFNNSLILKRFMFEAFDCYVALFYLAFYERNIDKLRTELVSVFNIDTIRRLALECLVPMVLQRITKKKDNTARFKKNDISEEYHDPLSDEADLDEYEQFDDYMEIVIQFGYVTLFASAYPLASVISIVANLIEIRSDCFKLTYICQRPKTIRCDGLNMWKHLLNAIVWLSALTNCLIFGFTSGQLMEWLPHFYYMSEDEKHMRIQKENGWVVIFIIFGMERLLLYTASLLTSVIPKIPEDVMDELERKHFVLEEESRQFEREKQD